MISKTQRNILISSLVQFAIGLVFFYYYDFWHLGLVAIMLVCLYTTRTLMLDNNLTRIWPKVVKPSLWQFLALFYLYLVRNINNYTLLLFVPALLIVVVGYGLIMLEQLQADNRYRVDSFLSLLLILIAITSSSLMQVLWHWPVVLIMVFVWLTTFVIALWWLLPFMGRMEGLAALWALVCVELVWISSRWIVLYQLPRMKFIISQPALIIASLAYSWGGMYYHHKKGTLTRPLLFEYLAVSSIVFVLVVAFTKWTAGF